jgi:outer membrane cobalamin receptor
MAFSVKQWCMIIRVKTFRRFLALLTLFLLVVSFPAGAKIRGLVKDAQTHAPVDNVEVNISGLPITALTDSSGFFTFDSTGPGSCNLLFTHPKYEPFTLNDVFVAGEQEKFVEVELYPAMQKLDKVVVTANVFRKPADMVSSTKVMNFDEILRAPGALVDVQRVIQDLPSVSSGGDNTNEIVVRGGNPGENLLLLDNMEIANPNHFAGQGSGGGVVSLINPLLVKGLTFCAGAPPAQYGGKASSVLDIKLRDGNDKMVIGGVDLGMAGIGAHAEGPLWKGSTFMASGSKSFLDLFANYAKTTAIPQYWGVQAKLVQNAGIHKLWGNVLYGDNGIEIENAHKEAGTDGDNIEAGGRVYAGGFNAESKWTSRFSTQLTLSGTGNTFDRYEYTRDAQRGVVDSFFVNRSSEEEQTAKLQASIVFDKSKLLVGGQFKRCDFDIDMWEDLGSVNGQEFDLSIDAHKVAYKYGAYLSGMFYPVPKLRLIPGIRFDGFTYNNSDNIAPRLGLVYALNPSIDLTAAAAVQYQDPDFTDLLAAPANKNLEPVRATSGIAGVEYTMKSLGAKFSLEGYYKKYDDLPVNAALLTDDKYDLSNEVVSSGDGYSYGLELFIHKKLLNHFSGSLAYSWSRAFNEDPRPGHQGEWYRSDYDFRNAFTITAGYKTEFIERQWYKNNHKKWWMIALSPIFPLADRVEISSKWRYLGGRPYTEPTWDDLQQRFVYTQDALNDKQYENYHKLDLRIERRYGFGLFQVIYYFDLQNIYNRDNVWMYLYSDKYKSKTAIYQFSFFPAGGVILGF